jgi:hypothetical protein
MPQFIKSCAAIASKIPSGGVDCQPSLSPQHSTDPSLERLHEWKVPTAMSMLTFSQSRPEVPGRQSQT